MVHLSKELNQLLSKPIELFCQTSHEIDNAMNLISENVVISDSFSHFLLHTYQAFFIEDFEAVLILMKKRLFLSVSKISRPMLEISAIISYLYQLPEKEREDKCKKIVTFEGAITNEKNNGLIYDWLTIIIKKPIKEIIVSQHLDRNDLLDFNFKTNDGKSIKLSLYNFLSKPIHYSQKFLKEILELDENKTQIYNLNLINVCFYNIHAILSSVRNFCIVFCEHFHPKTDHAQKILNIAKDFQPKIKACWNNVISEINQEETVEY
jgi:hypothetical protein